VTNVSFYKGLESITDDTALGDGHPMTITKHRLDGQGAVVKGRICNGPNGEFRDGPRCSNIYPDSLILTTNQHRQHVPLSIPSTGALAAELLALTNPSRPVVDLPVAVAELGELPMLLKGYGDGFLKALARGNLGYQFGIRPLISDLSSLLDFESEVRKRKKELDSLAAGGLRRKRVLWEGSATFATNQVQTNFGNGGAYFHNVKRTTHGKVWGFVRWKPSAHFPDSSEERARLARRAVLGLTVDFSTAWNLMPWSWMIDWCSSVGNFLMARRNIIPCYHDIPQIMTHLQTQTIWTPGSNGYGTFPHNFAPTYVQKNFGSYATTKETKDRARASATLDAHMPGLSLRQLSILGSLGISKYRG
jgi:hypothetical protein